MPLQTGFVFSFFAACKPVYRKNDIDMYPSPPDGYFDENLSSFSNLLTTTSSQNLSPMYYEIVEACLQMIQRCSPYNEEITKSSHLVFTFRDVPILIFENVSLVNSDYIMKIDFSYLVPHWISSEQLETRNLSEKRWTVLALLAGFLTYGFLN